MTALDVSPVADETACDGAAVNHVVCCTYPQPPYTFCGLESDRPVDTWYPLESFVDCAPCTEVTDHVSRSGVCPFSRRPCPDEEDPE